ncbi:MAG: dihydroorotate dehydrogenase [Candidatus Acetothermia bacterium]
MEKCATNLFGLECQSPTILASGILGTTPSGLQEAAEAGAGAVTTKSLGLTPRQGHPTPSIVQVKGGYLNAMGLPNPGVEYYKEELAKTEIDVPIIGSIYGGNEEEFVEVAEIIAPEVDTVELNLSCPHAEELGATIGAVPQLVEDITSAVKSHVDLPVIAKLTPNVADITKIGLAAQRGGADGVVAINTLRGMAIDIETKMPILGNRAGGLSGEAIHPVAVKAIFDLYQELSIPIIGAGGVSFGDDLVEFLLAGASGVEIGTAIANEGLDVFSELNDFLVRYLEDHDLTMSEIIGEAHNVEPEYEDPISDFPTTL